MRQRLGRMAACTCALALAAPLAFAQPYPTKPVRVIVPSQAGGGADIVARTIGQKLTEVLGQQFVVDNRIGIVGAEIVAKAAPDGYTLMFTTSALAVRASVYGKLPYDTLKDFQPVTQTLSQSNVLVVHPSVPAKNVSELVALAKSRPAQLNYGSGGNATSNHLAGELFKLLANIQVVHVPYRGVPLAITDVVAGRVQYIFGSPVSTLPQVKEGKLRLLAVTTPKRTPALPHVPTIAEAGLPGYEFTGWMGFFAPVKMPRATVDRLHAESVKILRQPEISRRLQAEAAEPVGSSPAEFAAFLKDEIARWTKVARAAQIKVD
jgi:tripartite-type tricarboxylate transporter receptor subunit TctC